MDETWRNELSEFIAIPSVSADPAHHEDINRAGEWVCDFIRRIGGTAELTPFGEQGARARRDPGLERSRRTRRPCSVYGHFDVQPPAPLELWETEPFELTIRDEWAYARGVTDDKGQLYILLKAAQKLVEANALPVNLRFACDGEEEIGGTTIVDWIAIDDVGANAAIIFDGGMLRLDLPVFDLATRGPDRIRREGQDRRAGSPFRYVRRRCAQRDSRADALLRCRPRRAGRALPESAAPGHPVADDGGARRLGGAAARGRRAERPGRAAARSARSGAVLRPDVRRGVVRRERDHRRQARPPEHDSVGAGVRRVHDPPRARTGRRHRRRRRGAADARRRARGRRARDRHGRARRRVS